MTAAYALVVALVGWTFSVYQLATDRWVDASELLLAAAAGAAVGAVLVFSAGSKRRLSGLIAGLLLIAVSASIFAYPLSAVSLVLLIVHIGRAISRRHRSVQPVA